jgi:hypothetical protein
MVITEFSVLVERGENILNFRERYHREAQKPDRLKPSLNDKN